MPVYGSSSTPSTLRQQDGASEVCSTPRQKAQEAAVNGHAMTRLSSIASPALVWLERAPAYVPYAPVSQRREYESWFPCTPRRLRASADTLGRSTQGTPSICLVHLPRTQRGLARNGGAGKRPDGPSHTHPLAKRPHNSSENKQPISSTAFRLFRCRNRMCFPDRAHGGGSHVHQDQ
ncbi:hypothetical protein EIP86_001380 [Pleurotus ostreatoroseus]|nr:hypothetical protein EIP86_001380 [Pleurotus ostreatoroseus]